MHWPVPLMSALLLLAVPAQAQERIGGFVEYDNILYIRDTGDHGKNGRNQGILQLELNWDLGASFRVFGALELRKDQAYPTRDRIHLDEAYLDIYTRSTDIRLGKQILKWGRADFFNPTDNFTAWDFADVLDIEDEELGLLAARVQWYPGNWTLDAVATPSFSRSVLPEPGDRWWPELPSTVPSPTYAGPGPAIFLPTYRLTPPLLPDNRFQYGLRLSRTLGGWDFSVSWFDGVDDLPAIRARVDADPTGETAEIVLESSYHRRRAIGADFATAFSSVGLHGEAAYYLTEDWDGDDPAVDDPYLQFVLGADYTFADVLGKNDLFILLEWIQEAQVPDRDTDYRITDLNHAFRKTLVGKADFKLGQDLKLTLMGVFNVYSDGWWAQPGLEWSIRDGLELTVLADLLGGPEGSFFGIYRDNKRLHARIRYSF